MNNLNVTKTKPKITTVNLNWQDNPTVQKLLDVVAEIMAEEYIQIARENEDVFTEGGKE